MVRLHWRRLAPIRRCARDNGVPNNYGHQKIGKRISSSLSICLKARSAHTEHVIDVTVDLLQPLNGVVARHQGWRQGLAIPQGLTIKLAI